MDQLEMKKLAARAALKYVKSDTIVGKVRLKLTLLLYLKENNNAIDDLRLRLVPKQRELRFF